MFRTYFILKCGAKRFEEKSNQSISLEEFSFTKRSEKKGSFSLSGTNKESVRLSVFASNLGFFPERNNNAFYHCLKKQREGEQKDVVQRGVGVVCRRVVVVVVRSNDVLVLVLL